MIKIYVLSIFLVSSAVTAQVNPPQINKTAGNLTKGFMDSFRWYDVPVTAAYFYRNVINPDNIGDKIVLGPIGLEESLSRRYGNENNSSFGSMDKDILPNYIFHARLALNISLNLFTDADISARSYEKLFVFKKSLLYTYVLTEYVKNIVKRTRPDGSDDRSFFSGHTSTTFAAATFLYKELHDTYQTWDVTQDDKTLRNIFESVSFTTLYGWASYVGYSRIRDKKHYFSDVLVGAIAGTTVSYLLYDHHFGERECFLDNISLSKVGKDVALSFRYNLD